MAALPIPPFPPRIAADPVYETCLGLLPVDPAAALAMPRSGALAGDAGRHCQALALIALGEVEEGAAALDALARSGGAPSGGMAERARAEVSGQASDAWVRVRLYENAFRSAELALRLAPDDAEMLIRHARVATLLGREVDAVSDLTRVLSAAPDRVDALLARAMAWRRLDRWDQAGGDIDRAAEIAPADVEVLLERGIQRQRRGDLDGARADWRRVVALDPDSETADLAEQNLALLDAGPARR